MEGLAKTAGAVGNVKKFVRNVTGKNEEAFHQNLLDVLQREKDGKAKPADISAAIKLNSLAVEDKYKARRQGAVGLAGATALGTGGGIAVQHHKKQTRLQREEGL